MVSKTEKVTVSLPADLVAFADEVASKKHTTRSKVLSECLREYAAKKKIEEMKEGYLAMAEHQREFAESAFEIAGETIPEWK